DLLRPADRHPQPLDRDPAHGPAPGPDAPVPAARPHPGRRSPQPPAVPPGGAAAGPAAACCEAMTDLSGPPFRADHVGSLLRPQNLLDARAKHAAGDIDDAELRGIEDEAIADVVRMQKDVGLRTATDGEFRRASWHMDFIYRINGITKVTDQNIVVHFKNADGSLDFTPAGLHVDGPLSIDEPIFGRDFAYLQSVVGEGQTPKLTIPSPSMVHYRGGAAAIDPKVYPDEDSFWDAL